MLYTWTLQRRLTKSTTGSYHARVELWINNFLSHWLQQVQVDISAKEWVTSGVPQGLVLEAVLFAILISDINAGALTSYLLTYAGDTKIFKAVTFLEDFKTPPG